MGKLLTFLAIMFLAQPVLSNTKPMHVVIDAGHGGTDSGAMMGMVREADITLSVSKKLDALLTKDKDFKSTMTRNSNKTVSLIKRTEVGNSLKGDLFLSIHVNSNPDPSVRGAEFYFQNQLPPSEDSLYLANMENQIEPVAKTFDTEQSDVTSILYDLKRTFGLFQSYKLTQILRENWKDSINVKSRAIRQAPFHVLAESEMPSVLIELGFLSNPTEAKWLNQSENHDKMAKTIYQSLKGYKESLDKGNLRIHSTFHAKR
jgi:N-acetylmuramoyl-L-alanine amidase